MRGSPPLPPPPGPAAVAASVDADAAVAASGLAAASASSAALAAAAVAGPGLVLRGSLLGWWACRCSVSVKRSEWPGPAGVRVAGDVSVWRAPPLRTQILGTGSPPCTCMLAVGRAMPAGGMEVWGIPSRARRASLLGLEGLPPRGGSSFQPFLAPCGLGARAVRKSTP